jgi:DNA recombination protein RmuC
MPLVTLFVVLALLVGAAIGYWMRHFSARSELDAKSAALESATVQLAEREKTLREANEKAESLGLEKARLEERLAAEQEALKQARAALEDSFRSAASRVLQDNSQAFLQLAQQELGKQQQKSEGVLSAKEQAIAELLKPVRETLEKLEAGTQQLEVKREGAYKELAQLVKGMQESQADLRRETSQLISALRAPKVRGNWGELQLRRCIEFAGMVEHASFDTEVYVRGEDSAIRPDCVVHLPNERTIVIDVKTPFDAFLEAMGTQDEQIRSMKLAAHAARVKEHLSQLAAKSYWKQFRDSPDFVVCFLSSEVFFSAALEQDPGLIEFGSASNVILATPTTLIALLKAVAYGWQQLEITRNAQTIRDTGEKLYEKLATAHRYFSQMGNALTNAVKHYNSLVGCLEGRGSVFTHARTLHELAIGQAELPEMPRLEAVTRDLKASDWKPEEEEKLFSETD